MTSCSADGLAESDDEELTWWVEGSDLFGAPHHNLAPIAAPAAPTAPNARSKPTVLELLAQLRTWLQRTMTPWRLMQWPRVRSSPQAVINLASKKPHKTRGCIRNSTLRGTRACPDASALPPRRTRGWRITCKRGKKPRVRSRGRFRS